MKKFVVLALAATMLTAGTNVSPPLVPPAAAAQAAMARTPAGDARAAMRKLWEDHITWTRVYIIDALAGLPDADAAAARLLRNQDDIGAAIVPYYGAAAGQQLTALLKDHIMIATEVLKAAKAGDNARVAAQQARWSANADQIAAFLSSANPNWQRATVRDMLQKHLDFTTTEVVSRLKSDWAADIAAYDANHDHMLMFSDALVDGIARQFPDRFSMSERG
ncbi:MAG: hypothetical protein ACJ8EG_07700 [Sphingomicrobium sp.]